MNKNVLMDSDSIIGLVLETDLLHHKCVEILNFANTYEYKLIAPYPIVLEATTALARKFRRQDIAKTVLENYVEVAALNEKLAPNITAANFDPLTSRKNTPFDYYLLSLAKINNINTIFSFDSFYEKNGLTLMKYVV